jgi:hypothetical protein
MLCLQYSNGHASIGTDFCIHRSVEREVVQWLKYRTISISPINTSIVNAAKPRAAPAATDRGTAPTGTPTGVKAPACAPPTSAKHCQRNRYLTRHLPPTNLAHPGATANTPSLTTLSPLHKTSTHHHTRTRNNSTPRPSLSVPPFSQ